MKKISKNNLKGLTEMFPLMTSDVQRGFVGGMTANEWEDYLMGYLGSYGSTYVDANGNVSWTRAYSSYYDHDYGRAGALPSLIPEGYSNNPSGKQTSWDCLFDAFIALYKRNTGITLSKSQMVSDYNVYAQTNAQQQGGANIETFNQFIAEKYGICSAAATEWTMSNQLLYLKTNDASVPYHIVRPESAFNVTIDGKSATYIKCWDETSQAYANYNYETLLANGSAVYDYKPCSGSNWSNSNSY